MCSPQFALIVLFAGIAATAQTGRNAPTTSLGSDISAAGEFSASFLRQECIDFTQVKRGGKPDDIRECRVSEFGEFGGIEEVHYYYALYCLIPNGAPDKGHCNDGSFNANYHRTRGLVVFVGDSSGLKLRIHLERIEREIGRLHYDPPQIARTPAGTILYLPIAVDGTAHENASEYFLWDAGNWQDIDSQGWRDELFSKVPAGLQIRKGVWPDLRTMETQVGLYRQGDDNASPTGGSLRIRYAIRLRRFVLDSVTFERPR
jgi:hypothetical protein